MFYHFDRKKFKQSILQFNVTKLFQTKISKNGKIYFIEEKKYYITIKFTTNNSEYLGLQVITLQKNITLLAFLIF